MPGPKHDRPPLPESANRPTTLEDPSLTDAELHETQRKKGDPVIGDGRTATLTILLADGNADSRIACVL